MGNLTSEDAQRWEKTLWVILSSKTCFDRSRALKSVVSASVKYLGDNVTHVVDNNRLVCKDVVFSRHGGVAVDVIRPSPLMSMLKKKNRMDERVDEWVQAQPPNLILAFFMTMKCSRLNILFLLLNFLSVMRYSSI